MMLAVAKRKKKAIDPTFGRRLRALREAAGLTQNELGKLADMHDTAVARLERGGREPGWETVLLFARVLKVEPNAFCDPPDGGKG